MRFLSSSALSGPEAETEALQELSDINSRLAWNLSALKSRPKYAKSALKGITRDLARLEKMAYISSTAIRKSQINMALQDVLESTIPEQKIHQSAQVVYQNFANIILADDLIHWSSDRRSLTVLLPTPGYPLYGRDNISYASFSDQNNATALRLLFNVSSDNTTLLLNTIPFLSLQNPEDTPRISADQVLYTHATDVWSSDSSATSHILDVHQNISTDHIHPDLHHINGITTSVALDIMGSQFMPDGDTDAFPHVQLDVPTQHVINVELHSTAPVGGADSPNISINKLQLIERLTWAPGWEAPRPEHEACLASSWRCGEIDTHLQDTHTMLGRPEGHQECFGVWGWSTCYLVRSILWLSGWKDRTGLDFEL